MKSANSARHTDLRAHQADTVVDIPAGIGDAPEVLGLLIQRSRVGLPLHVDIELCNGDFQSEVRESLEVLLEICRDLAKREVTLEAYPVYWDTIRKEAFGDVVKSIGLRVDALDPVIVNAIVGVKAYQT